MINDLISAKLLESVYFINPEKPVFFTTRIPVFFLLKNLIKLNVLFFSQN